VDLTFVATITLYVFLVLGALDGVFLHLIIFKLHREARARGEHLLHTARTFLMAAGVALVFALPTAGVALWCGLSCVLLDFGLGLWDAFVERESRAKWGGLGRWEASLHILLSVTHGAAVAVMLVSRPQAAWEMDQPWIMEGVQLWGESMLYTVVPALVGLGLVQLALMWPPQGARAGFSEGGPSDA